MLKLTQFGYSKEKKIELIKRKVLTHYRTSQMNIFEQKQEKVSVAFVYNLFSRYINQCSRLSKFLEMFCTPTSPSVNEA